MSEPPPLDYASSRSPDNKPVVDESLVMRRFLLGLGIGIAVSAIVWFSIWKLAPRGTGASAAVIAAYILVGAKVVSAIVFLCLRGWRGLGLGILCSMPLGFLMFFGACAATM